MSTQCSEVYNSQTRSHHGTSRTDKSNIQTSCPFHFRCFHRTQRGSRCVCSVLQRSSSSRRNAAQAALRRNTAHYRREIPDPRAQGIVYRSVVCTLHSHANRTNCSRYQQWATNVSKSPPTQMETRDSNCPLPTKSSDYTSSPAKTHLRENSGLWLDSLTGSEPLCSNTSSGWRRR